MTGSPDNANIFDGADVLVSFDLDAALPATIDDAFDGDWSLVGLLDGEDGFGESRDWDTADHFAWGNLPIRTLRKNFKLTRTFTAKETNATTDRLRWPGSTSSQVVVPRVERVLVAFETRDTVAGITRRVICRRYAGITPDGDIEENDSDVASVSFAATVFPDSNGVLFDRQETEIPVARLLEDGEPRLLESGEPRLLEAA